MRTLFPLDEQPTIHWKERAHYKGCDNLWTHCNMSVKLFSLLPTTVIMFIEKLLLSFALYLTYLSLSNSPCLSLSLHFVIFISIFTNFLTLSLKLLTLSVHIFFNVYFLLLFLFFLHTHTHSLKILLVCFYHCLFYFIFLFTFSFSLDINSLFLSIFVSFAYICKLL